eukprot:2710118-Prymnesium_polylepis.1
MIDDPLNRLGRPDVVDPQSRVAIGGVAYELAKWHCVLVGDEHQRTANVAARHRDSALGAFSRVPARPPRTPVRRSAKRAETCGPMAS